MGWEDRSYYRDRSRPFGGGVLRWILSGSVPIFTFRGIRVQVHASMFITAAFVLIFGLGRGIPYQDNVEFMLILFGVVLLHEFGHCFAARWVGGDADEIMMTPLGGAAMVSPPRRPLPTFLTVAAGPAVNVVICLVTFALASLLLHWSKRSWSTSMISFSSWLNPTYHLLWIFAVSMGLLLFNILPIFPLDGGQMLQSILWPKFGYYRSMMFACMTGIIGAVILGMLSLATLNIWMLLIWVSCLMYCIQMRAQLKEAGPYGFEDEMASPSYAAENAPRRANARSGAGE